MAEIKTGRQDITVDGVTWDVRLAPNMLLTHIVNDILQKANQTDQLRINRAGGALIADRVPEHFPSTEYPGPEPVAKGGE